MGQVVGSLEAGIEPGLDIRSLDADADQDHLLPAVAQLGMPVALYFLGHVLQIGFTTLNHHLPPRAEIIGAQRASGDGEETDAVR